MNLERESHEMSFEIVVNLEEFMTTDNPIHLPLWPQTKRESRMESMILYNTYITVATDCNQSI